MIYLRFDGQRYYDLGGAVWAKFKGKRHTCAICGKDIRHGWVSANNCVCADHVEMK